jgi:hypothetical protein
MKYVYIMHIIVFRCLVDSAIDRRNFNAAYLSEEDMCLKHAESAAD